MPKTLLSVGLVQNPCTCDPAQNNAIAAAAARRCHAQGAELIVFQELHGGRYPCQNENPDVFDLGEAIPGPTTAYFTELARELKCVLVISVFERRAAGIYHNTAVVLERDGSIAGTYRKAHIPDDPGYYEKFYFTPGGNDFRPIVTSVGRLGVMICWDQWFPEAARLMALAGADLLLYPSAIGYDPADPPAVQQQQRDAWLVAQRAHAIANGLPVVTVNRTGFEADPSGVTAGIDFWGSSFVAGPFGEVLYQAPADTAAAQVVIVDLAKTETTRRTWPFLRDRRIDKYAMLNRRFLDE